MRPSRFDFDNLLVMHMIFRTVWHVLFVGPRGRKLKLTDVSRSRFRVWPTDLDVLNHMNNGKYLSIMDIARFDAMQRMDAMKKTLKLGWYPVVVGQTISYRKSLNPWMRFYIETKILGADDQAVYLEQRFVRPDANRRPEIYARAFVRARFLKKAGGIVTPDELFEAVSADPADFSVPEEVLAWGQATKLPSLRSDATSVWS